MIITLVQRLADEPDESISHLQYHFVLCKLERMGLRCELPAWCGFCGAHACEQFQQALSLGGVPTSACVMTFQIKSGCPCCESGIWDPGINKQIGVYVKMKCMDLSSMEVMCWAKSTYISLNWVVYINCRQNGRVDSMSSHSKLRLLPEAGYLWSPLAYGTKPTPEMSLFKSRG